MKVAISSKKSGATTYFDVPFSYGDIVKVIRKGNCLINNYIKDGFNIVDKSIISHEYEYPKFDEKINEWKVIEFGANYNFELLVLIKNRTNHYAVITWNNMADKIPPLTLIRKCGKDINDIAIDSKY